MPPRSTSWILVAVNALGFPGVGTILAGRRALGWVQLLVGFSLFLLTLGLMAALFASLHQRGAGPRDLLSMFNLANPPDFHFNPHELRLIGLSVATMIVYLANVLWSVWSVRRLRRSVPPPLS